MTSMKIAQFSRPPTPYPSTSEINPPPRPWTSNFKQPPSPNDNQSLKERRMTIICYQQS